MKILIFCLLIALTPCGLFAQKNDPAATRILNEMSAKYKSYSTLRTQFVLKIENNMGKTSDDINGILHTKGDMFKLEMNGQEIYCDNKTYWTFIKDANEVQISHYSADDQSLLPSTFYTLYEKDYFYALTEEITVNSIVYQIIELTPHDKNKSYFKIRLTVDKNDKSITNIKVFDKSGSRYVYEIKKQFPNVIMNDSLFVFDVKSHPGVEVVDLR